MTWLLLLTLLGISLASAFYGASLLIWTVAMAAGIVVLASTGSLPLVSLVVIAAVFAIIAIPLNVKPWRQQLISAPFLKQFPSIAKKRCSARSLAAQFDKLYIAISGDRKVHPASST